MKLKLQQTNTNLNCTRHCPHRAVNTVSITITLKLCTKQLPAGRSQTNISHSHPHTRSHTPTHTQHTKPSPSTRHDGTRQQSSSSCLPLTLAPNSGHRSDSPPAGETARDIHRAQCFEGDKNLLPCRVPNPAHTTIEHRIVNLLTSLRRTTSTRYAYVTKLACNLCNWLMARRCGDFVWFRRTGRTHTERVKSRSPEQLPACHSTPLSQSQCPAALARQPLEPKTVRLAFPAYTCDTCGRILAQKLLLTGTVTTTANWHSSYC
jgi:hypothetical protein